MPFPDSMLRQAATLLAECRSRRVRLAVAESCTGGLIAALLTENPGSSEVFERGFVTYSNDAKRELLGVPAAMLEQEGAVSAQTACAMAEGALRASHADYAVAVTGIAGPGGGSPEKPVGLVYVAVAGPSGVQHRRCLFAGDRAAVRLQTAEETLRLLHLRIQAADQP